jgi:hypothetical protein
MEFSGYQYFTPNGVNIIPLLLCGQDENSNIAFLKGLLELATYACLPMYLLVMGF